MMAISNHAVEDSGASIVYTVPATGGTPRASPRRDLVPARLVPDGRWLVYVGERNHEFDVYKIAAAGGDEIRLTTAPGLDDGPEFTPDGAYIYFNSARSAGCRSGDATRWSGQEQITNDGFNNWFPHISPDGKWIAYIAFSADVRRTIIPSTSTCCCD